MVFFPIHLLIIAMSHDNKYNLILWANYTCKELIIKKKLQKPHLQIWEEELAKKNPYRDWDT